MGVRGAKVLLMEVEVHRQCMSSSLFMLSPDFCKCSTVEVVVTDGPRELYLIMHCLPAFTMDVNGLMIAVVCYGECCRCTCSHVLLCLRLPLWLMGPGQLFLLCVCEKGSYFAGGLLSVACFRVTVLLRGTSAARNRTGTVHASSLGVCRGCQGRGMFTDAECCCVCCFCLPAPFRHLRHTLGKERAAGLAASLCQFLSFVLVVK